jgi:catechol 2,3-dioxygenase-like lactoylglutathione lyase family enzyme
MHVKGIIWIGSATEDRKQTAAFFVDRLGMKLAVDVPGFSRLTADNGDLLEIFGSDSAEHDHLDTGPVAGFWVDDILGAHAELTEAEVEGVTAIERGPDGHRWFYFKAPDGNFYELCEHPRPRPVKGTKPE